jgi:amidase
MTSSTAIARLDAIDQAALVSSGALSLAELQACCLARIDALNPLLRAVVDVTRAPAHHLDAAGPLRGVPFLVKDVLPWPGLRWSMGSRLFAGNTSQRQTPLGKRLTEAGLYCAGKSAMSELGLLASTETLLEGVTHNPWDLSRSPAGSSGGSAVAVAAGIVPLAHANDGGGSIRMPASACGVFGFKPSRGRIVPPGFSASDLLAMTCDGCISRSVRDSALFLSLLEDDSSGLAPMGLVRTASQRRLRIASWVGTMWGDLPEPAVRRAHAETNALLRTLGHDVDEPPAPDFEPALADALLLIGGAAVAEIVKAQDRARREPVQRSELEPFTWSLVDEYLERGPEALDGARAALGRAGQLYRAACRGFDVVLTPTLAREPWPTGYLSPLLARERLTPRIAECMAYTPIQNIVGAPAMSVPLAISDGGLPIGMHFAAAPGEDATLLALAYELEQARPWKDRWPPYSIPALETET